MKKLILLFAILLLFACAPPRPPKVTWYIDPWKTPWQEYVKHKESCSRLAEAAFPIDEGELRKRPHLSYRYQLRQTYYLDCLQKKGHRVYCVTEKETNYAGPTATEYPIGPGTSSSLGQKRAAYVSD